MIPNRIHTITCCILSFFSIISQLHAMLENTASPDCQGPLPVRIEPALQHLIPLLASGLLHLFGSSALKNSWTLAAILGSGRASHKHQVARVLPLDTPHRYLRVHPTATPCSECRHVSNDLRQLVASILALLDSLSAQYSSDLCAMRLISACDKRPFSLMMMI